MGFSHFILRIIRGQGQTMTKNEGNAVAIRCSHRQSLIRIIMQTSAHSYIQQGHIIFTSRGTVLGFAHVFHIFFGIKITHTCVHIDMPSVLDKSIITPILDCLNSFYSRSFR